MKCSTQAFCRHRIFTYLFQAVSFLPPLPCSEQTAALCIPTAGGGWIRIPLLMEQQRKFSIVVHQWVNCLCLNDSDIQWADDIHGFRIWDPRISESCGFWTPRGGTLWRRCALRCALGGGLWRVFWAPQRPHFPGPQHALKEHKNQKTEVMGLVFCFGPKRAFWSHTQLHEVFACLRKSSRPDWNTAPVGFSSGPLSSTSERSRARGRPRSQSYPTSQHHCSYRAFSR